MFEAAAPAAAGGPGPAADFRRAENHHRYGAHRGSGVRYCGDHSCHAGGGLRPGGCGAYPRNGAGDDQNGHRERGFLRPAGYRAGQSRDCPR